MAYSLLWGGKDGERDCIAKRMKAEQAGRSGYVKPQCFQLLLKGGVIFPLFGKEDIITKYQYSMLLFTI